jgi:hypothetical protein
VFDYDCDKRQAGLMRRLKRVVTVVAIASSLLFHPWLPTPQTPYPGRSCSDALVSDDEDGATPGA